MRNERQERNFINAYAQNVKDHREANDKERKRLSKIKDFKKGDYVPLQRNGKLFGGVVFRVNQKTYSVRFHTDRIVRIGKECLSGIPNDIIEESSGDSRRFIGETIYLIKESE